MAKRVKQSVRYHERRIKGAQAEQRLTAAICSLTPDLHPNHKEVAAPWWARLFGIKLRRWSINGKIYPVKRPTRGKLVILS